LTPPATVCDEHAVHRTHGGPMLCYRRMLPWYRLPPFVLGGAPT
jgi:hypothetical protein